MIQMAGATAQDFPITHGESKRLIITVTGTDVTTATAITWVMAHSRDPAPAITKTLDDGVSAVDATTVWVDIAADDWADVRFAPHKHQLWVTDANGNSAAVLTDSTVTIERDLRATD